jgi:hypothetical protein
MPPACEGKQNEQREFFEVPEFEFELKSGFGRGGMHT